MAELLTCYRHPDRETGVSCSECGRGICPDCMTFSPVGIRCPDHSGQPRGAARVVQNVQRGSASRPGIVTTTLIAINVGIYLLQLAGGASFNGNSGWIYEHGALYGPLVAEGDWYRLITAAFLHYGPIHLGMNMLALWWIGRPLESYLGPVRYLLVYLVSGLAGSAGALIMNPNAVTVGASGAIFGILGGLLVLEQKRHIASGGQIAGLIVLNLVITFAFRGSISVGGHVGGLIAGIALMWAMLQFRRSTLLTLLSAGALVAVSFAVAYAKVRHYQ
jgi:membrane associated rhomboid family serine protease